MTSRRDIQLLPSRSYGLRPAAHHTRTISQIEVHLRDIILSGPLWHARVGCSPLVLVVLDAMLDTSIATLPSKRHPEHSYLLSTAPTTCARARTPMCSDAVSSQSGPRVSRVRDFVSLRARWLCMCLRAVGAHMDIAQLGNALTETSKVRVGHVMLCGVQCLPKLATSAKDAGELRLGHVTELANFGYTSLVPPDEGASVQKI